MSIRTGWLQITCSTCDLHDPALHLQGEEEHFHRDADTFLVVVEVYLLVAAEVEEVDHERHRA